MEKRKGTKGTPEIHQQLVVTEMVNEQCGELVEMAHL